MSPEQFLSSLKSRAPEPVYLFLGPEMYMRDLCRRALLDRALPPEQREDGFTRHSLDQASLVEVLDDARSMSLFAAERVLWCASAEGALPREATVTPAAEVAAYAADPVPGVTVVFDCSRFQFDGDDKTRLQRVQKFYGAVKAQVEFPAFDKYAARQLAKTIARQARLNVGNTELDLLVDVLDADATRIATEIEKLAVYGGEHRRITEEDIRSLVPDAQATTIFALVAALGRGDRSASLDALDLLTKSGEYLPLALTFLAGQFRMALAAREAGLSNAAQIESHFRKLGVPIWRSRAEQIAQTVKAFPPQRLRNGLKRIFETDKALRDTRPDDRTVMERFVLSLT